MGTDSEMRLIGKAGDCLVLESGDWYFNWTPLHGFQCDGLRNRGRPAKDLMDECNLPVPPGLAVPLRELTRTADLAREIGSLDRPH